jgi:uncharacterized protein DUF4282
VDQTTPPTSEPAVKWEAPPPPRSDGGFDFSDFLNFKLLITPTFIKVIYVIGVIVITLSALFSVAAPVGGGALSAIVVLLIGNLWWRIVLELVMVLFRINDSLAAIERRGRGL